MRVWKTCKHLLLELEKNDSVADAGLVEALLLASCFHDAGMAFDSGEKHGKLGSGIFSNFIQETTGPEPFLFDDIKDAIALHDSKDRSLYKDLQAGGPPGLLSLLSMADDLDALGRVGIYRYTEIYLKRGVPLEMLGINILANVRKRYKNICESSAAFPHLSAFYLTEFQVIEDFFNLYNQQLMLVSDPAYTIWGELGVIHHIRKFSIEGRIRPEDFSNQGSLSTSGDLVISFFKKLHYELEEKKF